VNELRASASLGGRQSRDERWQRRRHAAVPQAFTSLSSWDPQTAARDGLLGQEPPTDRV